MDNLYKLPEENTQLTEADVRAIVSESLRNFNDPAKVSGGYLQSANFVSGSTGWQLTPSGAEINGGVSVQSLNIPDQTTANSFHVDSMGNTWWGANVATGYTGANAYILNTGSAVFKNVSIGGTTVQYVITNSGIFSYGDGSDGAATFNGSATPTGSTKSSNTYTLTRDVYYTTIVISDGVDVITAGYRIFAQTSTVVGGGTSGKIHRDGIQGGTGGNGLQNTNSSGGTGTALADGYLKGAVAAGAGGGTTGAEVPQVGSNGTTTTNSLGSSGLGGGVGGDGRDSVNGLHSGALGGSGGTATTSNVKLIANWHLATLLDVTATGATLKFDNSAAAGGGGAGGQGQVNNGGQTSSGGGGGSGGTAAGIVALYSKTITLNAGASITANGGQGGTGGNGFTANGTGGGGSGGGGGGGGGNGGIIILVYNVLTNNGSVTASAGPVGVGGSKGLGFVPGTKDGTDGSAGTVGSAGTIYQFQLSL